MDAIDIYFLNRIQPDLTADAEGCLPNDRFWNASGVGPCCKSTLFSANVRYWHKADMQTALMNIRYRGESGRNADIARCLFL